MDCEDTKRAQAWKCLAQVGNDAYSDKAGNKMQIIIIKLPTKIYITFLLFYLILLYVMALFITM